MPEHGTVECFDEGCRAPVCVHAQQRRVEAARRAEVEKIAASLAPTPPAVPDEPGDVEDDAPTETPPSD